MMSKDRARILYIDDDPGLCRLVQKDLERKGYAVDIATGGASGLARIERGGIDVVALDHYMPEKDGLETLAGIRALADPPPVIYVTAMQGVQIAVAALKAGAADYVVKDAQGEFLPLLQRAIDAVLEAVMLRRGKEAAEAESMRTWQLAQCIVDTIRDPLVVLEHDMTIVTANIAFLTIFGITKAEMHGRPLSELGQRQWDVPTLRHLMEKVLPDNKPIESFEIEDDFPGLGRRVFSLNARKISRPGNHVHRMLLVFEDITDRKRNERDAQMLTNEVSHRIKNNLQIVAGLLSFEANAMPAPYGQGYKAMQARIGAIARLYDLISQSSPGGVIASDAYLEEIAKNMSASLLGESSDIKIEVNSEALDIGPDLAVPFGLLVNELATNAIKHAFPNGTGHIVLGVKKIADEVELTVTDDGVGMKTGESVKTSGKRGADYVAIFVRQLRGAYSVSTSVENGTTIKVRLPSLLTASPGLIPPERAAA
jgi:PAS domain S-box-containing protein